MEQSTKKAHIYYSIKEFQERTNPRNIVATLGLFDGVHLGHQHLIKQTMMMAEELHAESLIITLDKHPITVLRPDEQPPLKLAPLEEKLRYISQLGVHHILVLPFTLELSRLLPIPFISPIVESGLIGMMLGYDNRFGRKMVGETIESFDNDLKELGLEIRRVSTFELGGIPVSSSRIRFCLAQKNFTQLEELLGRAFSITGKVVGGLQIGRKINFPTANVLPNDEHVILPEIGVYVSEILIDGELYTGMSYYGPRPTIISGEVIHNRIEVYVFDFNGNLYDKELTVSFRHFIREDIKFDDLEQLKRQLEEDERVSREFFSNHLILLTK